MSKRRSRLAIKRAKKRSTREIHMQRPSGNSRYARKRDYCHRHECRGFEVPEPKPWKAN